jgi:methylated-DNA-protein-cysteine methyltransferase-like protein
MGSSDSYFEKVYMLCKQIPRGRVCTYGTIAEYLGLGSARMVGWALNKIGMFDDQIPAHRVVNSKGELSGRNAFVTPDLMQKKLEAEGIEVVNDKVVAFKEKRWFPEMED